MASPLLHGRRVDTGAAYFTARDDDFLALVARWRERGLVRSWTDTLDVIGADGAGEPTSGQPRLAAPDGLRALVRDLLTDQDVTLERTVARVDSDGPRPRVDGAPADAVVLAMPDPQAARLSGPLDGIDLVDYDPVIAVTAGYAERSWPIADAAFVNDVPGLSLVADDGARRGDGAAVLVLHTTPDLARDHLEDPDAAVAPALAALRDALGVSAVPLWTKAHRWTFAKPVDTHGDATYALTDGMVGLAGDSWCPTGPPRVESAWLSGRAVGRALAERL